MSKTILIVDDDVEMASIMEHALKAGPYEVLLAHNGIQAIEKSKCGKIDLILLDIKMPFFSGFWFCDAFKQRPATKDIPIIIVSGLSAEEDIQKAYNLGAAAFLKKPFQPDELLQLVGRTLSSD
jgi:CheY-like chemotaxis protein